MIIYSGYTVFELTGSFYKIVLRQDPREIQKKVQEQDTFSHSVLK